MNKKVLILLSLLLVVCFAFQGAAYDYDDEDEFDTRRDGRWRWGWRNRALRKTLSINISGWKAISHTTDTPTVSTNNIGLSNPDWLGSIGAKLWFYRSNLGIGIDAILLNSYKVKAVSGVTTYYDEDGNLQFYTKDASYKIRQFMIDVDVFLRLPLTPRFLLIGGAGITYFKFDSDGALGYEEASRQAGYNLKAGAELFLGSDFSVSTMFNWHHFRRAELYLSTGQDEEYATKLFSFMLQVNLYL